jgi:multiple sugar transport system permease protein
MNEKSGYAFVAPLISAVVLFAVLPLAGVFYLSLHRSMPIFGIHEFVGVENYRILLQDPRFLKSVTNTLYLTSVAVTLEVCLGLAFALFVDRAFRRKGWLRVTLLIPWMVPTVVSARAWEWMYQPEFGVINYLGSFFGIPTVYWLSEPGLALHAAILMEVWKTTPFCAILLLAGLQTIPNELYEAAKVDGANPIQIFRRVILPLLWPTVLIVLLFRTLDSLRIFDAVYVLTGGGPANTTETLSIYTYNLYFQTLQFGFGSAAAVATFLLVMGVSLGFIRSLRGGWNVGR